MERLIAAVRGLRVERDLPGFIALVACAGFLAGCSSIGPATIERDRFDYGVAISDSQEDQMLMNLVRVRYGEAPVFLNVNSVISQYSLESVARVGAGMNTAPTGENSASGSASLRWFDRPTITYAPISGQEFTRSILTPFTPEMVLTMIQLGWPVDVVFGLAVRSINGIQNQSGNRRKSDPRFLPVAEALARIQGSGAMHVSTVVNEDQTTSVLIFREPGSYEGMSDDIKYVREELNLELGVSEFELINSPFQKEPNQIAIMGGSVMDIIGNLAADFQIPPEHAEDGRALAALSEAGKEGHRSLVDVKTSLEEPDNAFAAVQGRGYWYYIDDRDLQSKRVFSLLLILVNLADAGERDESPVVTISTGS